jgi:hypothetical protein
MKKLRILAEARQEFADALRYYRRHAPAFAEASLLGQSKEASKKPPPEEAAWTRQIA